MVFLDVEHEKTLTKLENTKKCHFKAFFDFFIFHHGFCHF